MSKISGNKTGSGRKMAAVPAGTAGSLWRLDRLER